MQRDISELLGKAIPLLAEDLRSARKRKGISTVRAAKLAGLSWSRYLQLESGRVRKAPKSVGAILVAAERLGLDTARICYADFLAQHVSVGVGRSESPTLYIDTLRSSVSELRDMGHYISPHLLLDLVRREGVGSVVDSRDHADKTLFELWVTAIYTLCLDHKLDHYIRPGLEDPPDAEIVVCDHEHKALRKAEIEITRHGAHSASLFEVVGKKLKNRYRAGTVILVMVEEGSSIAVAELRDFVLEHNPHNQNVVVIGGAGEPGRFKILPIEDITGPESEGIGWREITVDTRDRNAARCRYDGIVWKAPSSAAKARIPPLFAKSVSLIR